MPDHPKRMHTHHVPAGLSELKAGCGHRGAPGEAAAQPHHDFWADDFSLLEPGTLNWSGILGSRQVTDAYLLALAVRRQGRFVTFDSGIDVKIVSGTAASHLVAL